MIEVENLSKFYGERQVLHNISFSVPKGKIYGLLGPNGSGKSTTMDILSGLLGPSQGVVRVCGYNVVDNPMSVKACIGYLPDNPPLHKDMRVQEFVDYIAQLRGLKRKERHKNVAEMLEACALTDVAGRIIGNLSKGFRQRVALCGAIVHKPDVLILDEPSEGLDPNQIVTIRNFMKEFGKDHTVLLSSHILPEIQASCDEVIIIQKGRIAAQVSLSGQWEQEQSFTYTFESSAAQQKAQAWFAEQNFIDKEKLTACLEHENSVLVSFHPAAFDESSRTKMLSGITQHLVANGMVPIGITQKQSRLDELFFDVIRSQVDVHYENSHNEEILQ